MNKYGISCNCCPGAGVAPCAAGTWPTTLFLTIGSTTLTLTKVVPNWFLPTTWPFGGLDASTCASITNVDVQFSVTCVSGVLNVIATYWADNSGSGSCPGYPPAGLTCYYSTRSLHPFSNTSTVTTFVNSPVSGTGTFNAPTPGTCPTLGGFSGMTWSLSQ